MTDTQFDTVDTVLQLLDDVIQKLNQLTDNQPTINFLTGKLKHLIQKVTIIPKDDIDIQQIYDDTKVLLNTLNKHFIQE